ncbi:hypothetical protein O3M35_009761 [Rhynocoris fuscipes]|uniref:Odorant receptor n=1 Tax=Rhynocoris fuscipes TaxID=488301 RepID=A0AAW1D5D5_9HEMI
MEKYRLKMLEDKERAHHIEKADILGAKIVIFYYAACLCFPFYSLIINFIIDYSNNFKTPHLVIQLWIPWKVNELWPYIFGNSFTVLASVSMLVVFLSFSVMELTFTFQFSAFLKVLQNRLDTKGPADKTVYQHHRDLIQFLKEYNDLFSGPIYLEVLVSSIQPCGFGYALIKAIKRSEYGTTFDFAYKLCMTFLSPLLLCACGQEISNQMERLHESTYMCKWYEEEPKVRRDLYTMMLVTVRPMTVNYRLFVVMNFACFSTVCGCLSYLFLYDHALYFKIYPGEKWRGQYLAHDS